MTFRNDEIASASCREVLERELTKSVAQVLHLLPGTHAAHRRLHDVGVEFVLSVAFIRAADRLAGSPTFAEQVADAATAGPVPPPIADHGAEDLAGDYARAKAEVMAVLRGGRAAATAPPPSAQPGQASTK